MRTPNKAPALLTLKEDDERDIIRETRTYRFLTYVMGGGVKVDSDEKTRHQKERDKLTPIRVASIRGQLRFWWRACNPQNCTTVEELRAAEAKVWGSAEKHSSVIITVKSQPGSPKEHKVYEYVPRRNEETGKTDWSSKIYDKQHDLAYGAFPLQPSSDAQNATPREEAGVLYDYGEQKFKIEIGFHKDVRKDVEAALWAWETFGGLGARTRRGFGAIERTDNPTSLRDIRLKLGELAERNVVPGVPSLAKARFEVATRTEAKSVSAWLDCLKTLRSLRQAPGLGRNPPQPGSRSPAGRSRWPEPERIRHWTKQRSGKHKELAVQVDRFPRASFGMPIVFHFQNGAKNAHERGKDPADTELKPADADRMASPLILRPIRDGSEFRACGLVLNAVMPAKIILKTKDTSNPFPVVRVKLEPTEAAQIEPMKSNGKVFREPLDRFLEELKKS